MLLFTRHVLDIAVDEIPANGGATQRLLSIKTENSENVAALRSGVYSVAERGLDELASEWATRPAPHRAYRHSMIVESGAGQKRCAWQVAIGFYPDHAGVLLEQARKLADFEEKAIPEVGVAVALHQDEDGEWKAATVNGRLYCSLPLPAASGFPAHINGCFDLDSSRMGLTSDDEAVGNAKARVDWNRLLLKHAVAAAYVDALRTIPAEIMEADPDAFYGLWPNVDRAASLMLREAAVAIHQGLAAAPLFRCATEAGFARCTLAEILVLPTNAEPGLMEPLVADGLVIADPPLPYTALSGATAAGLRVPSVTPALLRKRWLRNERRDCELGEAPSFALRRRDWLEAVTRFVISDPEMQLAGTPARFAL